MNARVYRERHWFTGKVKVRCALCEKVVFPDEHTALASAALISKREPMAAYQGRECGHWHVARRIGKHT